MQPGSFEEFERHLKRGDFRPVYCFLGSEEFLRRRAVSLLTGAILPPDALAFNFTEFDAQEDSIREVVHAANTFPMLAKRRMVILTNIEALDSEAQAEIVGYLKRPADKAVMVLAGGDLDRRTSFYRTLVENTAAFTFAKLKGAALERWADEFIRSRGCTIRSASLRKLIDLAGTDLDSLLHEVDKLLLYAGEAKAIPDSAIDDLVRVTRQHGIFELTGAIGRRDTRAALQLLGNLIESGEPPLVIVTMMARHFRQVLIAKEQLQQGKSLREVAAAAQIPPFVADEFIRQVRALQWTTADKIFRRLADADHRLKSSNVEPRMLLESLICSL